MNQTHAVKSLPTTNQNPPIEVTMSSRTTSPFVRAIRMHMVQVPSMTVRITLTVGVALLLVTGGVAVINRLNGEDSMLVTSPGLGTLICALWLAFSCGKAIARTVPYALALGLTRTWTYLGAAALYSACGVLLTLAMYVLDVLASWGPDWLARLDFFLAPQGFRAELAAMMLAVAAGLLVGAVSSRWGTIGAVTLFGLAMALPLTAATVPGLPPSVSGIGVALGAAALAFLIGLAIVRRVRP